MKARASPLRRVHAERAPNAARVVLGIVGPNRQPLPFGGRPDEDRGRITVDLPMGDVALGAGGAKGRNRGRGVRGGRGAGWLEFSMQSLILIPDGIGLP
jgi:hypothetical protein